MDLFCIDQSPDSPISISEQLQAIPQIYKSSRITKVLIETPLCREWPETASRARLSPYFDVDVFTEAEIRHSRKCPNMLIFDPWFERLWTRQEGLYAMKIEMVVLAWIQCRRHSVHLSAMDRWTVEGGRTLQQQYVKGFIRDKLTYHGSQRDANEFNCYFDLIYNRHLNILDFNGRIGPAETYLPVTDAWRSARRTTHERDYVLAVMPDVDGYTVPKNARRYSFKSLLADAFDQFTRNDGSGEPCRR